MPPLTKDLSCEFHLGVVLPSELELSVLFTLYRTFSDPKDTLCPFGPGVDGGGGALAKGPSS